MAVKNPRESVAGNTQHSRRLSYVQTEWLQAVFANAAPRMGGDCSSSCLCLLLMVVCQADVVSVSIFETKSNPPVSGNRNAPVSLKISLQRVKPVTGQVEVRGTPGNIQVGQHQGDAVDQVWTHLARITVLVQAPETSMTETSDHAEVCRIPVQISTAIIYQTHQ